MISPSKKYHNVHSAVYGYHNNLEKNFKKLYYLRIKRRDVKRG